MNLVRRRTFASLSPRASKTVTAGATTRRYENRSGGGGEHAPRERSLAADAVVRATRLQPNTQLDAAIDRQRDVIGWPLCNEQMREDESRESREREIQTTCRGHTIVVERRERRAICCLERRLVGGRNSTYNECAVVTVSPRSQSRVAEEPRTRPSGRRRAQSRRASPCP